MQEARAAKEKMNSKPGTAMYGIDRGPIVAHTLRSAHQSSKIDEIVPA